MLREDSPSQAALHMSTQTPGSLPARCSQGRLCQGRAVRGDLAVVSPCVHSCGLSLQERSSRTRSTRTGLVLSRLQNAQRRAQALRVSRGRSGFGPVLLGSRAGGVPSPAWQQRGPSELLLAAPGHGVGLRWFGTPALLPSSNPASLGRGSGKLQQLQL